MLLLGKEDSFFAGKLIDMLVQILAANLCSTLGTLGERPQKSEKMQTNSSKAKQRQTDAYICKILFQAQV